LLECPEGTTCQSAVLEDVGFLTKDDKTMIDKNEVAREREKLEMELQMESSQKNLRGLYFDGRKDSLYTQIPISDKKFLQTLVKEEHVSPVRSLTPATLAIQHWHKQKLKE